MNGTWRDYFGWSVEEMRTTPAFVIEDYTLLLEREGAHAKRMAAKR